MKDSSEVVSEDLSTEGNPRDRSICFQTISSDQDLFFLETGSIEPRKRSLPRKSIPREAIQENQFHAIHPFYMIPTILSKVLKKKVPLVILVTPAWPS